MRRLLVAGLLLWGSVQAVSNLPYLGTDERRASIDLSQILSPGPPPQGIPSLGFVGHFNDYFPATVGPVMLAASAANLQPQEPVLVTAGQAFPMRFLVWHELVNHGSATPPLLISYSPTSDLAAVFDRRIPLTPALREEVLKRNPRAPVVRLDPQFQTAYRAQHGGTAPEWALEGNFGHSGMLLHGNHLFFDAYTGTVYSQFLGQGVVGTLSGVKLLRYPAQVISWGQYVKAYPAGQVLAEPAGFGRNYNVNPYLGFDDPAQPLLLDVAISARRPAHERVVGLDLDWETVAYPYPYLAEKKVVNDQVSGMDVVLWWQAGNQNPLNPSQDQGMVGVFNRQLGSQLLTFEWDGSVVRDRQTGSQWNLLGLATSGPLAGKQLEPVLYQSTWWAVWSTFKRQADLRP